MSDPITMSELQEILRLHTLWLRNENGGKRANLSGANLRWANLSGANLILVGQTLEGYLVWAFQNDDGVVVARAGCQTFIGIQSAYDYVDKLNINDPVLLEDHRSLADRCERMAKACGWQLEPVTEAVNQ